MTNTPTPFKQFDLLSTLSLLHPFLFVLFVAIASLAAVKQLVLPEETVNTVVALELITLAIFLLLLVFLRNKSRAAIVCSGIVVYLLSFRLITSAIDYIAQAVAGRSAPDWLEMLIYVLLAIAAFPVLVKTEWTFGKHKLEVDHKRLNLALTLVSAFLVLSNLIPLAMFEWQDWSLARQYINKYQQQLGNLKLRASGDKPDVYYIILDGYADWRLMKSLWGMEADHEFVDFLKSKGFYVVSESASNYDRTEFSISSSMDMQFIDDIPDQLGKNYAGLNLYGRMIQASVVPYLFKSLGYKYINISSSPHENVAVADRNFSCTPFNDFTLAIGYFTPLYETEKYFPFGRDVLADIKLCVDHCLPEVMAIPGPKFVFMHSDLSHAPCLFDAQGNRLPLPPGAYMRDWGTAQAYFAQWKYTHHLAMQWITKILDQPGPKPIIIVQSDHGTGITCKDSHQYFNERMRILNAYYFPGQGNKGLYSTITPVNSFRVLFNDYFDARLPLLPDRVICAPDFWRPYYWQEVRSELDFTK